MGGIHSSEKRDEGEGDLKEMRKVHSSAQIEG